MSDCNEYEEICLYSINKLHSYYKLFWYCDDHDDIYYTLCADLRPLKKEEIFSRISSSHYPKNENNICGGVEYSCSTLFVGYRSYSDDGKILEDTTDNFNFEKRDSEYLREILEDSKLIEDEVESNIKPPRH
jgi:hypothetical protein